MTVNKTGKIVTRETKTARQKAFDLGNGVMLEMVYIPAGTFVMGSPESEKQRSSTEGPQRRVTLAPFYMGKFLVTQAQWAAVMGKDSPDFEKMESNFRGNQRPMIYVSWNDCQEFLKKLNATVGALHVTPLQTPIQFRLPSEAEWEYAARAGTTTPFFFGDTISADQANYDGNYTYGKGKKGVYREQTTDVGSFPPNAFGLYDLHDNVWEWCQDVWHDSYNGAPTDGSAWEQGGDVSYRLLRGGSWVITPSCRSACRGNRPGNRSDLVGVRVLANPRHFLLFP